MSRNLRLDFVPLELRFSSEMKTADARSETTPLVIAQVKEWLPCKFGPRTTGFFSVTAWLMGIVILAMGVIQGQSQEFQWAQQTGGYAVGTSVVVNQAGEIAYTGYFWSPTVDFGTTTLTNWGGTNSSDLFLVKCDKNGQVIWAQQAGGENEDQTRGLAVDAAGNLYVTGYFSSSNIVFGAFTLTNSNPGVSDLFVAKYDPSGQVLWAVSAGGSGQDGGTAIAVDPQGNVYVTGGTESASARFGSLFLVNTGKRDVFLAKLNAQGIFLWVRQSIGIDDESGTGLAVDTAGHVNLAGWFYSPTITFGAYSLTNRGGSDIFLVQYNVSGQVLWARQAGGTSDEGANALAVDAAGNLYVAGDFYSTNLVFETVQLTNNSPSGAASDLFLAKYNVTGALQWVKTAGGTGNDAARAVTVDSSGAVCVAGYFWSSSLRVDGMEIYNANTITGFISPDIFIAKYETNGSVAWLKQGGNTLWEWGESVAVDLLGNVYITGEFNGPTSFDSQRLHDPGDYDGYLVRFSPVTPQITRQPQGGEAEVGASVIFTVEAAGQGSLTYRWQKNGVNIGGAIGPNLVLTNVATNDAGTYAVVVADAAAFKTSAKAILTVVPVSKLSLACSNQFAILTLEGIKGQTCTIQTRDDFGGAFVWQTAGQITLTNSTGVWIEAMPEGQPRRFYRTLRLP